MRDEEYSFLLESRIRRLIQQPFVSGVDECIAAIRSLPKPKQQGFYRSQIKGQESRQSYTLTFDYLNGLQLGIWD